MNTELITNLMKEIIDPENYLNLVELTIGKNGFSVEFSKEYSRPKITFEKLERISEIFGTKLINLSDGSFSIGCNSCDYGSSYGVIIFVEEPTKNI